MHVVLPIEGSEGCVGSIPGPTFALIDYEQHGMTARLVTEKYERENNLEPKVHLPVIG